MKPLLFLFSLLLSTASLASSDQEIFLNSLSHEEGKFLSDTLSSHVTTINQSVRKDFMVRAYPFYTHKNYLCRDITLVKNNTAVEGSACKMAGDWIFILE
jgi:hypothetical protein